MAQELARLPYVTYDTSPHFEADVQYFLTYSTFQSNVSPVQLAYFTHLEERDDGAREKFFSVARNVDLCICMAKIYAHALESAGREVVLIPPGVDLEAFKPVVKVGVVGRTYPSGRKGEELIRKVLDIPGIEWHFTGEGWPLPARRLEDSELPDFYNGLDYLLVPSSYEGGPMPAIEALACGVEVISSDVGWMPELPHIPFAKNDATDLRRVLQSTVDKRQKLSESVAARTWEEFVLRHDRLFDQIGRKHNFIVPAKAPRRRTRRGSEVRAVLLTHGNEKVAQGGPSTRVPKLASALPKLGIEAEHGPWSQVATENADVAHVFNVSTPPSALEVFNVVRAHQKPLVFSPIYLDVRCSDIWQNDVPDVFQVSESDDEIRRSLAEIREKVRAILDTPINVLPDMSPGYHSRIAHLLDDAQELVFLSEHERLLLESATGRTLKGTFVPNPVDHSRYANATGDLFRETFGVDKYVLCVGRIEGRKNQLTLAYALRDLDVPLVIVGHSLNPRWEELIRKVGGKNLHLIGRIPQNSDLLASAYAGASCFAFPSWSEGAPLVALEAASAGAPLVLSTMSSEREYFQSYARYVDPLDVDGIRTAVQEAIAEDSEDRRKRQKTFVAEHYSVEAHAEKTAEVYRRAINGTPSSADEPAAKTSASDAIFFDVTTLMNSVGRISGITRVEMELLRELKGSDIRWIAWNARERHFFEVPEDLLSFEQSREYLSRSDLSPIRMLPEHAKFFIQGNAWLGNSHYVDDVTALIHRSAASATLLVHDILPISHAQYFPPEKRAVFEACFQRMYEHVHSIATDSFASKASIERYLRRHRGRSPEVHVVRLGDGIRLTDLDRKDAVAPPPTVTRALEGEFVLSVGSLSRHKNRELLYEVWAELADELGDATPTLLIVGGGADNAELLNKISSDPRTANRIVVQSGLDDAILDLLYSKCLFTVFPSLCEGWGLPVGESLAHGKICIASNTSSMVEIAPQFTDLVDPKDDRAWVERVRLYVTSSEARSLRENEIKAKFVPASWSSTAAQLMDITEAAQAEEREFGACHSGVVVNLASAMELHKFSVPRTSTFIRGKSWGVRLEGRSGTLGFRLFHTNAGRRSLLLQCRVSRAGDIGVRINGEPAGCLEFQGATFTVMALDLPDLPSGEPYVIDFDDEAGCGLVLFRVVAIEQQWVQEKLDDIRKALSVPVLNSGQLIEFGSRGPAVNFLGEGWHSPEAERVWSAGPASIIVPVGASVRSIVFQMTAITSQEVEFHISGGAKHRARLGRATTEVRIPTPTNGLDRNLVEFTVIPSSARSPASLGIGSDQRVLGVCLLSMRIEEGRGGAHLEPAKARFGEALKHYERRFRQWRRSKGIRL